jgi:light-regulated signal transduction histidine kinase (bacteriophytochrome)
VQARRPGAATHWYRRLEFRLNLWYAAVLVLVFGVAALGARVSARREIDQAQHLLVQTEIEQHRTLRVTQQAGRAQVSVSDTGTGIEAVHLDKIWQRLYRADQSRSRRGLGLGLSFVKAIVEAHGGRVAATSQPGRGSLFEISLPLGLP